MNVNIEMIVVVLLVGGSLWHVARGAWQSVRAANSDKNTGCSGCNACGGCPSGKE